MLNCHCCKNGICQSCTPCEIVDALKFWGYDVSTIPKTISRSELVTIANSHRLLKDHALKFSDSPAKEKKKMVAQIRTDRSAMIRQLGHGGMHATFINLASNATLADLCRAMTQRAISFSDDIELTDREKMIELCAQLGVDVGLITEAVPDSFLREFLRVMTGDASPKAEAEVAKVEKFCDENEGIVRMAGRTASDYVTTFQKARRLNPKLTAGMFLGIDD